jgi:hypothetical protein
VSTHGSGSTKENGTSKLLHGHGRRGRVLGDVLGEPVGVAFAHDLSGGVRGIEDMPAAAVAPIEATGIAPVQAPDRRREPFVFERSDQVVVRRHEAEPVADEKALGDQLRDDLDAVVIIPVVAEDVLLRDRPRGDVKGACVRRAHPSRLPARPARSATRL